jgi:ribosomal protein L29
MKKTTKNYTGKKVEELVREEATLRMEIAKLQLEAKSNPQKDSNMIFKKRKQLAVLLTIKNNTK